MEERIKNMSPEELRGFQKSQCIFCQIIEGKIPAKKVYEDEKVVAVLDINPANLGHMLVLPREHYMIMPQVPEAEIGALFSVVRILSQTCIKSLSADGTNIVVANGAVAGQRAQHFMIHVIPRTEGDGVSFTLPQKSNKDEELDAISAKMSALIAGKPKEVKEENNKPVGKKITKAVVEADVKEVPDEKHEKHDDMRDETQEEEKKPDDINIDDIAEMFKN